VGGNVEDEEIGSAHRNVEHAGVGVHAAANVAAGALNRKKIKTKLQNRF